jgi:hypothetical protein
MSQHDFNIANQGFPAFRSDLNDALGALASLSSGATEPTTTYANQLWYDSSTDILKMRNSDNDAWISIATLNQTSDSVTSFSGLVIGTDVQAYDADNAVTDAAQTFTASQRGTVTTDNDMSFDMSVTNNFSATPTGTPTLTFTSITAGQSGNIYVDNAAGATISAAVTTFINASDLTTLSTAGKYWLSYYSPDGTNVYVSTTPATTSQGV